ncbi:MAG: ketopantoate reductase family protein [Polyangiaceae bacterium]|nr:ketopantoate reductase family protein [Polyangiaceae bacterium]
MTISTPPPNGASARSRYLVVGAGGIGGIVAAHLIEQGHDVTALTTNPVIADAINAYGYRIRGDATPGTVRGVAVQKLRPGQRFDFVLLATQPPQVEAAARSALEAILDDGRVVCFQNGLCEERVGAIVGPEKVIGAVVAWGASMIEPGVYDRTSSGGFQLGRWDSADDPRTLELASALECIGPVTVTHNLTGARWSKLAINAAISSLGTVGGDRLGVLMRHRFVRRLALEIMTETTEVARALGIRLEKVAGTLDLDWLSLTPEDRKSRGSASLLAKHALLLAVGARYRRLRSSMLSAIERGREPSVDYLNGEVVSRGATLGIPTPINEALRQQVLDIAAGKAKSSHTLLRQLFDRTRPLVEASPTPISIREPAPPPLAEPPPPAEPAPAPAAPATGLGGVTEPSEPLPEAMDGAAPAQADGDEPR